MSIGELANLYASEELVIRPEFQRFFRWGIEQKSRLIESILLGIPLPSIFVMQRHDGVWEVIDGLQRVSTILEFMGLLRDEDTGELKPRSVLEATDYLPSLAGHTFDSEEEEASLSAGQRIALKRAKLDVKILLPESDEKAKYELFDRLNTGGAPPTPQEVRNAQLIMRDRTMYDWLVALRDLPEFGQIVDISNRKSLEQYDLELVSRAVAINSSTDEMLRDLGNMDRFLTTKLLALASHADFDRESTANTFERVAKLVAAAAGDDAFRRYDANKAKFLGPFSVASFEAITTGLWVNLPLWESSTAEQLTTRIQDMWSTEFASMSGTGIAANSRVPKVTPWARDYFSTTE
ncbi:DUF262 domain-containing protein [Microbacterium sp. NPDC089987]|uniref:DUF262 domain-containing protein n=1 Tax=Microbacterium sp. NPDC089987 TaxID=3364202 RepID=UPI0037F953CE